MTEIIDIILCVVIIAVIIILIYNNFVGGSSNKNSVQNPQKSSTLYNNTPINMSNTSYKKTPPDDKSNGRKIKKKKKVMFGNIQKHCPKEIIKKRPYGNTKQKSILKKEHNKSNDKVYMDLTESGKYIGRIIIKLFMDVTPKTCKNFYHLCKEEKYKGSPFHRIIKDFMIQGGDYTRGNGTGGMSIYGQKFNDENFDIPHDRPYLLSMANSGPDTNGSQFFITTSETPHLDGKHVVFGEVISGHDVIDYLNDVETSNNDRPVNNVIISKCGAI